MKKMIVVSLFLMGIAVIFVAFIRQPETTFSEEVENGEDIGRMAIGEHVDVTSDNEDFFQAEFVEDNEKAEEIVSVLNALDLRENRGWFREDLDYSDRRYHIVFYDHNDDEMYTLFT